MKCGKSDQICVGSCGVSYEESHILVPKPNHAFPKQPVQRSAISASQPAVSHLSLSTPPQQQPPPHLMGASTPSPTTDSDAPHTPGMMDLEMDDAPLPSPFPIASFPRPSSSAPSPWSSSSALVPQTMVQTPQCVPPSLLTYSLPPRTASPATTTATTPVQAVGVSSPAVTQTKASKKDASATPGGSPVAGEKPPKKKREKKEKVEGDEGDGEGGAGEKRFRCPVDGCGKVYKQQNGLKCESFAGPSCLPSSVEDANLGALLLSRPLRPPSVSLPAFQISRSLLLHL